MEAALRVLQDYGRGQAPNCDDVWKMQLSVSPVDAADLFLGHEELARRLVNRTGFHAHQR